MRNCLSIVLAALLLVANCVTAVEVDGLYEAEVPVDGQETQQRRAAMRTALQQVLVKISGQRQIIASPALRTFLDNAHRYVQQYRFIAATPGASAPATATGDADFARLWVRFDRAMLEQKIQAAGYPVWGKQRPSTLFWVAVQDGNQRRILGAEDLNGQAAVLDRRARQRGLPVVFPLLDLDDQMAVSVADIWGDFSDGILQRSSSYRTQAVVIARAYPLGAGLWEAHWALYLSDDVQTYQTRGELLDLVFEEGLDLIADGIASQFAVVDTEQSATAVDIVVGRVDSLTAYRSMLAYLDSLDAIRRFQVVSVEGDELRFRVWPRTAPAAVFRAIGLGNRLELDSLGEDGVLKRYRLNP